MSPDRSPAATFLIVAGSATLFSSKGVFAKVAFSAGTDAITVLALRMALALPFFIVIYGVVSRRGPRLPPADWLRLAGLGFIGYYFSSFVNFTGLQYISVGLERIILYTYPSIVLAISAIFLNKRVSRTAWAGCAAAWGGIVFAYLGEVGNAGMTAQVFLGGALVFLSALTYAGYLLFGGKLIERLGALRVVSAAVAFSALFMLLHYGMRHPMQNLLELAPVVYGSGAILAVFGTVLPALLMGIGLRRAGAQRFAVISTVGPVATVLIAWGFLGERPHLLQWIGLGLTLAGGLGVSLASRQTLGRDESESRPPSSGRVRGWSSLLRGDSGRG